MCNQFSQFGVVSTLGCAKKRSLIHRHARGTLEVPPPPPLIPLSSKGHIGLFWGTALDLTLSKRLNLKWSCWAVVNPLSTGSKFSRPQAPNQDFPHLRGLFGNLRALSSFPSWSFPRSLHGTVSWSTPPFSGDKPVIEYCPGMSGFLPN